MKNKKYSRVHTLYRFRLYFAIQCIFIYSVFLSAETTSFSEMKLWDAYLIVLEQQNVVPGDDFEVDELNDEIEL